jgi:hypothetical protein
VTQDTAIGRCAAYEEERSLAALLGLAIGHFHDDFAGTQIATKVRPSASASLAALRQAGFSPLTGRPVLPRDGYYVRRPSTRHLPAPYPDRALK